MERHHDTIRELAQRLHRDVDLVRAVYERELARLDAHSKVKMYIPVFASRATIDALKPRHH